MKTHFSNSSNVISTDRGEIEYSLSDVVVTGKPVVLSLHGGIGGIDQSRLIVEWVDQTKFRLLCVSRPGYLNTPLSSGYSLEDQALLFEALLNKLNITKVIIVATSAGGPPAFTFAAMFPERVSGLISIDSVSRYYEEPESGWLAKKMFTSPAGQKLLNYLGNRFPHWFSSELLKTIAHYTFTEFQRQISFVKKTESATALLKGFLNAMYPYSTRRAGTENDLKLMKNLTDLPLEQIKAPTLIIHGTHDADVHFHHGVYAFENIENATKHWIYEGSHLGFWIGVAAAEAQYAAGLFLDNLTKQNNDNHLGLL